MPGAVRLAVSAGGIGWQRHEPASADTGQNTRMPHLFARYQCRPAHYNGNFTAYRLRNYHGHENVIAIIALPADTIKRTAIGNPTLPLN